MSAISPDRWQRVKEILQLALERDPAAQREVVAAACSGDESLQQEVESLLAYRSREQTFMEVPAADAAVRMLADETSSMVGCRIGPYRIAREIGRGGMGTVYLATREDEQFRQEVALKLVKRGMDTDLVIRRFRNERQILANLRHPNIATLLDGGTTEDGLPYFVMEYVPGIPIDEYCTAHQLTIAQRLKLFGPVCSAVQYAHRNLVVHRDLKPSNIMVTADGVPKLLDFGIAKFLDPEHPAALTELTLAARPMTPEYASPEQARGEPVTVASDVYSLGVLLYELLTGRRPYRFSSSLPHEVTRIICEQEPERPSTAVTRTSSEARGPHDIGLATPPAAGARRKRGLEPWRLRRQLRGDLDNLLLMAIRKEPERRYTSVEQFSEDIRRYLKRLPLRARPDTFLYRSTKFIRRNRLGVTAATLILLILVGSIVMTTRAARRAERRFNDVRTLANSFMFEFHDAIKDLPGSTPARALVVRKALQYLDGLAREGAGDASLQLELAAAYQKIGDVQGNHNFANLGDTAGAIASYHKAAAIHEALLAANPANVQARRDLAVSDIRIGDMMAQSGDATRALESYRSALAAAESALAADPTDALARRYLALSHHKVGNALMAAGDLTRALAHHANALALRQDLSAARPWDARARRDVSISYERVSKVCRRSGELVRALDYARKATAISEALALADPTNGEARRDVGVGYQDIGLILMKMGDLRGALEQFRKGLVIDEEMAAADPRNAGARRGLASSHTTIGDVLAGLGDMAGAAGSYRRAIALLEKLAATDPDNVEVRAEAATSHGNLGDVLLKAGDTAAAVQSYRKALAIRQAVADANSASADAQSALARSRAQLGGLYETLGSSTGLATALRMENWRVAKGWYQRSLDQMLDMRKRGITPSADAGYSAEELTRRIEQCDAALKSLRSSARLLEPY
jgi:serine/threonine protein kinase/tetratricopeptide (TPR) repeat protein